MVGVLVGCSCFNREIFGPVLPIVPVEDIDEAIEVVNTRCVANSIVVLCRGFLKQSCCREHALSLYVFTNDQTFKDKVFSNTQSGSALANEVLIHVGGASPPHLPMMNINH